MSFKNKKLHQNYDANKEAALTLKELTKVIAIFIIKVYSLRRHSTLKDAPLQVYKRNLIESGIGIPDILIGDEARDLILDFMKFEERTIQDYGVMMFGTTYRSPVLEEYRKLGKEVK